MIYLLLPLYVVATVFFVLALLNLKSEWPKRAMIIMTVAYIFSFAGALSAPVVLYVMMHDVPDVPPSPVILWLTMTFISLNVISVIASMPISWILYQKKKRIKAALITGFVMLIGFPTVNGMLAFLAALYLVSQIHG